MTDVELLPLPSVLLNWPHPTNHAAIRDYARSNVAHATARLRAHRDRLTLHVLDLEADRSGLIGACDEYRQRAERLAEALREVESELGPEVPLESDDTNPVHRALDAAMAALNQEEGT